MVWREEGIQALRALLIFSNAWGWDAGKIVEQLMLQYGLGREEAAGYVQRAEPQ